MVLWGLCGWMEDGRLVTTADQAGTSALRKTMKDLGYNFKYVYDIIGKPSRVDDVLSFVKASAVFNDMRSQKIGQMGYRDMHLYGTMFDGCSLKRDIGVEIECFEMLEVVQRAEKISSSAIDEVINTTVKSWKFLKEGDMNIIRKGR
jgi:L-fucose isomerase-like protein